jgi:ribosomal protein S18 acetylase RimI-like enzyme
MTDTIKIIDLSMDDHEEAADLLTAAFLSDPLMSYLSGDSPAGHEVCTAALMRLSITYRLHLGWPALGIRGSDGRLEGVIGMSAPGPTPDSPVVDALNSWYRETIGPDAVARYAEYGRTAHIGEPEEPHHYVGVIAVRPGLQGKGHGRRLLTAARHIALADPASHGIWLDTSTTKNVAFYQGSGYEVRAESVLGDTKVWGLYHSLDRS